MLRKVKPKFKQMAFETAVRNPERYKGILDACKDFQGLILNDENLLNIVSKLHLVGEVSTSSFEINESTTIDSIKTQVKEVHKTRKADGGFPEGYQSRFWTYMRTLSELGLVYARYNKEFKFSEIAKNLLNGDLDEQEVFSIQAMKYNRKSPYRNVSNDFNFFRFILKVLIKLKEKNKKLSYEQFILAMTSKNGNVDDFLEEISKNKFKDFNSIYNYLKDNEIVSTKIKTVTADYPDVVRRILIISGFISISYQSKKFIQLNESKIDYINELLNVEFNLTEEEKNNDLKYFEKLNAKNEFFLNIVDKYRKEDKIEGNEYTKKIFSIIDRFEINENKIKECIKSIGSRVYVIEEFKEIPDPLKLEFYISILIALKYGKKFAIKPNYKADHIGKPYSHAPGNGGDIEVFSNDIYWLIEVTLIRNRTQQLNHETTSIVEHLSSNEEFKDYKIKYLSFVAPVLHSRTTDYLNFSIFNLFKDKSKSIYIKPYTINDFVESTVDRSNFIDMEDYSRNIIEDLRKAF